MSKKETMDHGPKSLVTSRWSLATSCWSLILMGITSITLVTSCFQGSTSEKPPIHLNPNMDYQEKFRPQSENAFFENRMSMRMPVSGTVPRGGLKDDSRIYNGKDEDGNFLDRVPFELSVRDIEKGRERYNIYCTPCHGLMGDGNGSIPKRGFPPPPTFHNDRARAFSDGFIYDKIANGSAIMPSYAHQISLKDRWAIVAYIRALQLSQYAGKAEITGDL